MSTDILLKRVEVLIDQERYDLAEKELRKLLAENPEHADVVANLVRTLTGAARNDEARQWSLKLLALDPNRAYFYYLAAFVEVRLRLFDEAETHIRRAVELEPEWAMNFEVLSRVYQHRGKYEEGLAFANEGLRLDPDHIDCLDARAFSLAMLGRKDEARQTIEHALSLEPENPYLRRDIGVAFSHLGDYHSAETHLRETLRLDPGYNDARTQLHKTVLKKHQQQHPVYRISQRVHHWVRQVPMNWILVALIVAFVCNFLDAVQAFAGTRQLKVVAWGVFGAGISVYIVGMAFQLLWAPVEAAADIWLMARSRDRHLFTPAQRRPYYLQLLLAVVPGLLVTGSLVWFGPDSPHVAQSLTFAFLGLLILWFIRRQSPAA